MVAQDLTRFVFKGFKPLKTRPDSKGRNSFTIAHADHGHGQVKARKESQGHVLGVRRNLFDWSQREVSLINLKDTQLNISVQGQSPHNEGTVLLKLTHGSCVKRGGPHHVSAHEIHSRGLGFLVPSHDLKLIQRHVALGQGTPQNRTKLLANIQDIGNTPAKHSAGSSRQQIISRELQLVRPEGQAAHRKITLLVRTRNFDSRSHSKGHRHHTRLTIG